MDDKIETIRLPGGRTGKPDYVTWQRRSAGTFEILDIAVYSQRRSGRGTMLVDAVIQAAGPEFKTLYLFAKITNPDAHRFYEAVGFYQAAILPNFYRWQEKGRDIVEPAVMFVRSLP